MLRLTQRSTAVDVFDRPDGMPDPLYRLLTARGIQSIEEARDFLSPNLSQLHDPMLMSSMGDALRLIEHARSEQLKVCIYGDYDVDGVCATAILCAVLSELGLTVKSYIPSRHDEGYGLNDGAIREIATWANLIITVDCGVNAVSQVELAHELGLTVLVTDHHQPGDQLPDCPLINPLLNEYPFPSLCGAGVAFKLAMALSEPLAMKQVDLVALATVADVVPLVGENRVLVAEGLSFIKRSPRPGIQALIDSAGVKIESLKASNIAFQLAPRLNASGRLGDADRALNLLTASSLTQAHPLAEELEQENTQRREVEQTILKNAYEQMDGFDFVHRRVIVLHGENWNVGVIGLAASRLVERYHLPVVLLSGTGEALTGSCRSIPGVDIHGALKSVSHLLTRFGGHKQAAGLQLQKENLPRFILSLDECILEGVDPSCFIPGESYDLMLGLDELSDKLVELMGRLEPFGFGNPSPVFLSCAHIDSARRVGNEGAHLSLRVSDGDARLGAIGFRMADPEPRAACQHRLLYAPKMNTFNGRTDVQLELKRVLPPEHSKFLTEIAARLEDYVQLFLTDRLYNRAYPPSEQEIISRTFDDLSEPFEALRESPYGTLVVAGDEAALSAFLEASSMYAADDHFDLLVGHWPCGEQPMNAVCLLPVGEPPAGYERLFTLDVPLSLWQTVPSASFVSAEGRAKWLEELPDKEQLRLLYRMSRDFLRRPYYLKTYQGLITSLAGDELLGASTIAAGLPILRDMQLIHCQLNPPMIDMLPMQKKDPDDSTLYQFVQSLSTWRR